AVLFTTPTEMTADTVGMAAARRPIAPITIAMAFRITVTAVRTIQTATDTKDRESPEHRLRRPAKLRVSGILRASHSRRSANDWPYLNSRAPPAPDDAEFLMLSIIAMRYSWPHLMGN
ncbi:MAG: hypothetical protein WBN76_07895, partial [Azonexus sp.]